MARSWRCLMVSDVHLSNALPHARVSPRLPSWPTMTDRFADQLQLLDRMSKYARTTPDISTVIVLGDLFDKRLLDAVTLAGGVSAMRGASLKWLIGPGNHEASDPRGGDFNTTFLRTAKCPNIRYIGNEPADGWPTKMRHGDWAGVPDWLHFWWLDYMPARRAAPKIDELSRHIVEQKASKLPLWPTEHRHVLLLHHSVNGCADGGWVCDDGLDPDVTCEGFDAVVSGHFHDAQTWGSCGMYLGSPLQLNYGDAGTDRGFWDVTFHEGGDADFVFQNGECPRFHVGEMSFGKEVLEIIGGASIFAPTIEKGGDVRKGDYVRFVVEATRGMWDAHGERLRAAFKSFEKTSGARRVEVVHRVTTTTTKRLGSVSVGTSLSEISQRFLETVEVEGLDSDKLASIAREAEEGTRP